MIVEIDNPTGIDLVLAPIQRAMYNYLTTCAGWSEDDYNSYPRAYINPDRDDRDKIKPEIYIGSNQYREALFNDRKIAESYFIEQPVSSYTNGRFESDVFVIFQVDLVKLYPTITHRADEEAHRDVFLALKKSYPDVEIINKKTTVNTVYQEFDKSKIKLSDMSPRHVFRFDLKIKHGYKCIC